jgi:septal ring factor EnvC (AmiA/AmiB activator)
MKEKSKGPAILLGASFLKKVDEWRRKQRDHPSRAVAIRRLAERGLASSITPRRRSKESRRKAAEMADREIEHLGDQAANNEERARRKRQLIQGPREFRDIRADWRKNKG